MSFESCRCLVLVHAAVLLVASLPVNGVHGQFSTVVIGDGAERNISSGTFGGVLVEDGGTAVISGGNIAGLTIEPNADVTLVGDDFWVNDTPLNLEPGGVTSVEIRAGDSTRIGDLVSGRLADGQPVSIQKGINSFNIPRLGAATIRFERTTVPVSFARVVDIPGDEVTRVTAGQTLRLLADKSRFEVQPRVSAYQGSRVEISGERWTPGLDAYSASIHMTSGNAAPTNLYLASEFFISGGTVNGINQVLNGSRVTVTGGSHPDVIWSTDSGPLVRPDGGEVVIVGTEFSLLYPTSDVAVALNQLNQPGDSVVIERREPIADGAGGTLPLTVNATLMDGQPYAWELSKSYVGGLLGNETIFADRMTARFTVGFPQGYCDFDSSGECDDVDISLLQSQFGSHERRFDLNYDGAVDERDERQLLQNTIATNPDFEIPGGLDCDFDNDNACGFSDINLLMAEIVNVSRVSDFDINWDGMVDLGDRDAWLVIAGSKNIGTPYLAGDANLDGKVNQVDLNALGVNWQSEKVGWDEGNFDAVSGVGKGDLNVVGLNWQQLSVPAAAAVPEPSASLLAMASMLGFAFLRRQKKKDV